MPKGNNQNAARTGSIGAARSMRIGEHDFGIIRCLHEDARMSIADIAKRVGAPESTVRNRLAKLIGSGTVDLVAVTDPLKLGYQLWIMMGLECSLAMTTDVAEKLCSMPEVYFVALATGDYNIILSASFGSNDEHLNFVTNRLPKIRGVNRAVTHNLLKIYKRQFSILPPGRDGAGS
jgi:Lrp/AsnC family transcriptional regulator for asnA, asnC and gidA